MVFNFNMVIFLLTLTMGVVISLSSNNWMSIWIGIELSMMSFLPFMKFDSKLNSESCLKYFIFQSLSSSIMMMGVIMNSLNLNYNLILIISLLIKLGMVPFHSWMLSIIDGMNYLSLIILLTLLKLAPLNLISYLNFDLQLLVMLGLFVGSISAMNKNSLKKILGYSSIYNMSMMMSCINEYSVWTSFMMIYIYSNLLMVYLIFNFNFKFINQVMINNYNMFSKLSFLILLLSMGGMPPFFMFIGKMMIIENLIFKMNYIVVLCVIFSSLLTMFFYIRISILSMVFYCMSMKWTMMDKMNTMNFMNFFMIMMSPFLLALKSLN